jgi:hypothetical protein
MGALQRSNAVVKKAAVQHKRMKYRNVLACVVGYAQGYPL